MARRDAKWAIFAGASLLVAAATGGCGPISPQALLRGQPDPNAQPAVVRADGTPPGDSRADAASATPGANPLAAAASSGAVPVKRDSITETLALDGLVTPPDQVTVTYPGKGTIAEFKVKAGDSVKQGDVLVDIDSTDLTKQLSDARTQLDASIAASNQAHAQADAQARASAQQAVLDQQTQQTALADAQTGLRKAQDNLAKVQSGATAQERQSAQTQVDAAASALAKAQAAQDKLQGGPDADAIKAAQREITAAQVAVDKNQADLNTLTAGPNPSALREAQAQVTRAENQLQIAQLTKPDPKADPAIAKIQQDAAVRDAQLSLQAAQDNLAKLKLPPSATDVQAAKQRLQDAQDTASAAQAKLAALQAGPPQDALDAAQAGVDSAQQALNLAQASQAAVLNRPSPVELADAQDQVRKAQAGVDAARTRTANKSAMTTPLDPSGADDLVQRNQAEVARLQQAMEDTHVKAPFDAEVVGIKGKVGDPVTSSKALIVLSKASTPIISLDVTDTEAARLAPGQQATVTFDTASGAQRTVNGSVASVTPASADGSTAPSATLQVSWQALAPPKFGTAVQTVINVDTKQDVLVVPKNAVRTIGDKSSVMVLNGTLRRLVGVQVGVTTDTTVEIVSGLSEGQLVVPQTI